ncbi:MAG: hypothetical protein ABIP56_06430 [Dokdonella sp.]
MKKNTSTTSKAWVRHAVIVSAAFCLSALLGCATTPTPSHTPPSNSTAGARPWQWTPLSSSGGTGGGSVRTDLASRDIQLPAYQPIRRYQDFYTYGEKNVPIVVEYGWDYARGVARETVFDLHSGKLISTTDKPGTTLNLSDREVELAISLLRENAELKSLLSTPKLNFYAGFPYREASDPDCFEHSRCAHVIVSAGDNGERHIAHAIVDLATRKVVHPIYEPSRTPQPFTSN